MSEHEHATPPEAAGEQEGVTPAWQRRAGRPRTPWSSEAIAVIGTGVALLAAMIGGFLSLNNRLDELTRHREVRLEAVRMHIQDQVETFRQTVGGSLDDQGVRMNAFEVRLAQLEVRVEGPQRTEGTAAGTN